MEGRGGRKTENKTLFYAKVSMSSWPGPCFQNPQADPTGENGTLPRAMSLPRKKPSPHDQERKPSGRWQGSHPQASKFSPCSRPLPSPRLQGPEPGMTSPSAPRLHPACPESCLCKRQPGTQLGKEARWDSRLKAKTGTRRETGSGHIHVEACGPFIQAPHQG